MLHKLHEEVNTVLATSSEIEKIDNVIKVYESAARFPKCKTTLDFEESKYRLDGRYFKGLFINLL